MKNLEKILFLFIIILSAPAVVLADVIPPAVSSLTVPSSVINSGQVANFAWTITNGSGNTVNLNCPPGVIAKRYDYSVYNCNTTSSISSPASDALSLILTNNNGGMQNVTLTVTPVDLNGVARTELAQTRTISVNPNQNPIDTLTLATSTQSGATTTVSWTATAGVPGANMLIGCDGTNIQVYAYSISNSALPCNTNISTTDLPASGSINLNLVNRTYFDSPVTISVVSSITPGTYNAIYPKSGTIVLLGMRRLDPAVLSLNATPSTVASGATTVLSWTAQDNAGGINGRLNCNTNVNVVLVSANSSSTPACGGLLFNTPFTGQNFSLRLTNLSNSSQGISVEIFPALADGTYSTIREQVASIMVLAPGVSASSNTATTNTTTPVQTNSTTANTVSAKYTFTKALSRGSKGAEVTELQKFFARFPESYGKVTVNGTYGPATEALVMKFQVKHGIAKKGQAGYGNVGPGTRKKLNELQ